MNMELLDFCYDILIRILEEINPEDLAACARTSSGFNNFIKGNQRLYKAHYLRDYDDPRQNSTSPEPDWVASLQGLVRCQKLLETHDVEFKRENFKLVAKTVDEILYNATHRNGVSKNIALLTRSFAQPRNLDAFMHRSSLYQRAGTEQQLAADNEEDRQLSAKLHCLHGMGAGALGRRSTSTHPYARSRIYDLRNYTDKTEWGPFRDDGSGKVDWEMIESVMIDLSYNTTICCPRFLPHFLPIWSDPFGGVVRDRVRANYPPSLPKEPDIPLDLKDPYNVSGLWHRIVCFLDYNDLFAYNFSSQAIGVSPDEPRSPLQTDEAIRHIIMRLQVTEVLPPGPYDNPALPIVKFAGVSKSMDVSWDPNANSKIRGEVRLTCEGEVRWTTISVFFGEERWRSEGIQVGGINSKRGVTGTWFDKDFDPHGPAGPTAFWKMADKVVGEDLEDEEEDESDGEPQWIFVQ
ncbi:hypothetical protein BU24DRAFT_497283 [Aaosphaeria arxii CBS 175.79]|uniref:F-box domain-containing protein n=1 Tax=Aaosphaeria arxii CBS 175.79 TaxID=1450172 RepID=A0A6A5XAB9_9PLEO|nr:uncharacterized protein BU24DRAFT_497283 [Aaosphaeria arxii CBS 175.79]KAF2009714.1 hypothetical protein BU24DRAFT_497283 [Aaosphaeria arxii CBS 175.79]